MKMFGLYLRDVRVRRQRRADALVHPPRADRHLGCVVSRRWERLRSVGKTVGMAALA